MEYVYIGLRSLTEALRAREILEKRGITGRVTRFPNRGGGSCAYALKLRKSELETARRLLRAAGIRPGKVAEEQGGGHGMV